MNVWENLTYLAGLANLERVVCVSSIYSRTRRSDRYKSVAAGGFHRVRYCCQGFRAP